MQLVKSLTVKTSAVLDLAADYLIQFGWCQGSAKNYKKFVLVESCEYCIRGAIASAGIALRGDFEAILADYKVEGMEKKAAHYAQMVVDSESASFGFCYLIAWNDIPGRTRDEVVNVLWKAADLARANGD